MIRTPMGMPSNYDYSRRKNQQAASPTANSAQSPAQPSSAVPPTPDLMTLRKARSRMLMGSRYSG
jgi:hypothetical protein